MLILTGEPSSSYHRFVVENTKENREIIVHNTRLLSSFCHLVAKSELPAR